MNFKKIINEVIPEPGHFIVFEDEKDRSSASHKSDKIFMNIFIEKEKAKKIYAVYKRSRDNADSLLKEAELLLENGFHARAIALAIMSFEELGKSQIAADFYTGILPEDEYKKAFRSHKKTSFACRYATIGSHENIKYGLWIDDSIAKQLESIRQSALYVDETNDPLKIFGKEDAELIIQKVRKHIEYVKYAEDFNGRIGSKALFK